MAVEELYCSLNKLLDDICKFLTDETNYKNLSLSARKQADELINRSKHQLQKIAKVTSQNNDCDGAYVNMEQKIVDNNDDDNDNIYSSVNEVILSNPSVINQPQINPYANLPAKEMSKDVKFGSLMWKCRIILKFEKMRRIYAGIHNNWLLIYSSEKDSKPLQTFNLQYHKAQILPCKSGKNQSQDFELISTEGESKTYFFTALTYKDMMQWTTHINNCCGSENKLPNLLSISEENISEAYDMIDDLKQKKDSDDEEEQIYHDIEPFSPNYQSDNINVPPELPLRRSPKSPLPVLPDPTERNKKELLETGLGNSFESNSSFSEDDEEDAIYESFVPKVSEQKNSVHVIADRIAKIEENKNISRTNSLEERRKPATPVKPKFLKGALKPPVILKK